MFLTTVRVRRARAKTLDTVLTTKQLADTRERRGDLVEVMCHGRVVAIADMLPAGAAILWVEPQLAAEIPQSKLSTLTTLVVKSHALMAASQRGGLCDREPETV